MIAILYVPMLLLIAFGPTVGSLILQQYTSWPLWIYIAIALPGFPISVILDVYMLMQRQKDPNYDPWNEI